MPSATSGKILVTGASGYVGAWIVKYLVEQGYSVLVAVRAPAQGEFIAKRFPEYAGKIEHIIVPDIEADGAYDEAVKNVDGIIHAASPVVWQWEDPSEITGPAVKGAVGILKSAKQYGTKVKRVVLTSSSVSIVQDSPSAPEGTVYDETTWNEASPKTLQEKGKQSNPWEVYAAAKVLAEKAAWDFIESEKPSFDFATVIPVWCWGPFIHDVSGTKGVGTTPAVFLSSFPAGDLTGNNLGNFVDVRDAALLHVLALKNDSASNKRIVASNRTFSYQDMYDVLLEHNIAPGKVPGKETKGTKTTPLTPDVSGANTLKLFPGFQFKSLDTAVKDMGEGFVKHNFL